MTRAWVSWLVGAGVGLAWACGGAAGDECPIGSDGCSCTEGNGCDAGLACFGGTCSPVGGDDSGSGGSPTSGPASMTQGSADDDPSADDEADSTIGAETTTATDDGPKLDVGSDETGLPGSGCQRVDMLFVLDSSGSMIEERQALAATDAFTSIVETLAAINGGGIEYRIGVSDDKDGGFESWGGDPWFDSTELTVDQMAIAFNGAVGQISGEPPLGCEHVLTSAVDLLDGDASGFVRDDALLVLVLVTDVDDYGAYDQLDQCLPGFGCQTPSTPVDELLARLVDDVKGGQADGVAAVVVAGDPSVPNMQNFCGAPASCGCGGGGDCDVFHATRLYELTDALGANGYAANLCTTGVPQAVEAALTESIDLACMNFEPEG